MQGIGDVFDFYIKGFWIVVILFVPMGLWKWIEIIIWLLDNISIKIGG